MTKMMPKIEPAGLELEIVRDFEAPVELVFDAWTDVNALRVWMGPQNRHCPKATADPVLDGKYAFPMEAENGETSTVVGHYTEIERPYRLAFTWSWLQENDTIGQPMHVALDFERLDGNRTRMKMAHTNLIDEAAVAAHNEGWLGCFVCLDRHLAE